MSLVPSSRPFTVPLSRSIFTNNLFDEVDRVINSHLSKDFVTSPMKSSMPKVNTYIENDQYVIEANVAGWPEDKLHVEVEQSDGYINLHIRGDELDKRESILQELSRRAFYRIFKLEGVSPDPTVLLKDGILKCVFNLVKKEPVRKSVTINK